MQRLLTPKQPRKPKQQPLQKPSTASKKSVIEITSEEEYDEALDTSKLCVVYFTAVWCGPCQMIKPIYEQMAEDFDDIKFLKVDVDDCADIAGGANVRAMPTFHFMRGGKKLEGETGELVGADPGKLLEYVNHHSK